MEEKYPIKAIQEMKGYGALTRAQIYAYAKNNEYMNNAGTITEKGEAYLEYRSRRYDGQPYLAITKSFADMIVTQRLQKIADELGWSLEYLINL